MIISVNHLCGHASPHVLYGSQQQRARQREDLTQTRCPDCFQAKVMSLTGSQTAPRATVPAVQRRR